MEIKTANGTWNPKLSMSKILDINKEFGVNLLDLRSGSLAAIGNDLGKFFAVLWESVKEEAEAKGISQQQFVNGFENGDQLEEGHKALVAAVMPFFQSKQQDLLGKFLNKWETLEKLSHDQALERVDAIDIEAVEKALKEVSDGLPSKESKEESKEDTAA